VTIVINVCCHCNTPGSAVVEGAATPADAIV
jgi:hypothetical protein